MTNSEAGKEPAPVAPGYGDQGPAGAGRAPENDDAAETDDEPVDDPGGSA